MSASNDEEKRDSGREGDVADEMENMSGVLGNRCMKGECYGSKGPCR